jgi:ABC-2 type transport system ATP-binding protein
MHTLELLDVSKRYRGRLAIDRVDLALAPGTTLGLLGPNGAGKTTLLRMLLGFAPPSAGTVRLRGRRPSDPAARRRVGYLPERLQLPVRTRACDFLLLHARLAGLHGDEANREVDAMLALTGIADRRRERIGNLSKGLRQRLGFAQALLGEPELLLLDEPTSGLDPIGMRDAREWIQEVQRRGAAVLVSSHVLSEVERTCDRIAVLHEGRVVASGPTAELVGPDETLEDAFLRTIRG